MDTEQTPPEADTETSDDTTEGSPAQTVRVPNVSPNAKSGLDHTIIGSNALADAGDDDQDDDEADDEDDDLAGEVPEDQEEALRWVTSADDSDTTKARADAVWDKHGDPADTGGASDLAGALRSAVYGDPAQEVALDAEVPTPTGDSDPAPVNADDAPKPDPDATDADES